MLRNVTQVVTLLASLATTPAMLRITQLAHATAKLTPEQQFLARIWFRRAITRYDNRMSLERHTHVLPNGRPDGLMLRFYDGQRCSGHAYYAGGHLHGVYATWYRSGQLHERRIYDHGQLTDVLRTWHLNGQPEQRVNFRNGLLHGECTYWYSNGQLMEKATYCDGKQHGEYLQWGMYGTLLRQTMYKDGLSVIRDIS